MHLKFQVLRHCYSDDFFLHFYHLAVDYVDT